MSVSLPAKLALITSALLILSIFSILSGPLIAFVAVPILFVLALFVPLLVHEAGHALAAKLMGLDILMFKVVPILATRRPSGWLITNVGVLPAPGFVLMAPSPRGLARNTVAMRWATMGGPMANLALAAAIYLLDGSFDLRGDHQFGTRASNRYLVMDMAMPLLVGGGLIFGLGSLIPMSSGGMSSDGRTLLALRDARFAASCYGRQQNAALALREMRPRDWPDSTLDRLDNDAGSPDDGWTTPELRLQSTILLVAASMDRGEWEAARLAADRALRRATDWTAANQPVRVTLQTQLAFTLLWLDRDAGAGRALLDELPVNDEPLYLLSCALLNHELGFYDSALDQSRKALSTVDRLLPAQPGAIFERNLALAVHGRLASEPPPALPPTQRVAAAA